jgi:hypothetical protein
VIWVRQQALIPKNRSIFFRLTLDEPISLIRLNKFDFKRKSGKLQDGWRVTANGDKNPTIRLGSLKSAPPIAVAIISAALAQRFRLCPNLNASRATARAWPKTGHPESFHRKARRRRQLVVDFDDFFRPGYQESPFRDRQTFFRKTPYNEKLGPQRAAFGVNVFARNTCQVLKPLGWHEITDFFVYLPNNAFQERLVPFAVSTEQPYFARMHDADDIVALLQQQPAAGVDENSASNLAMLWPVHNASWPLTRLSRLA